MCIRDSGRGDRRRRRPARRLPRRRPKPWHRPLPTRLGPGRQNASRRPARRRERPVAARRRRTRGVVPKAEAWSATPVACESNDAVRAGCSGYERTHGIQNKQVCAPLTERGRKTELFRNRRRDRDRYDHYSFSSARFATFMTRRTSTCRPASPAAIARLRDSSRGDTNSTRRLHRPRRSRRGGVVRRTP